MNLLQMFSQIAKDIEEDGRVRVEVSQTVLRLYAKDFTHNPHLVKDEDSARRVLSSGIEYDAFKEDIAIVHLYWDTPSVLQFERALRLTWVDYLAQVWLRHDNNCVSNTILCHRLEVCLGFVWDLA